MSDYYTVKRALILEPSGNLWGSERVLLDFLAVASQSSWQIGVCCPPDSQILKPLSQMSVQIFPYFVANLHLKNRSEYLKAIAKLLTVALRFKPHLLYINQAGVTRIGLLIARFLRIPIVTHIRLAEDAQYIHVLQANIQTLPKMICISQFIRNLFPDTDLCSLERLTLLYDPYIPQYDWNKPTFVDRSDTMATFGCVGRLAYIKGQDVVLWAIAQLLSEGVIVHGIFLGTAGPEDNFGVELLKLSMELNLNRQVSWLGFQDHVLDYISMCTALICPSRVEPLGRVIFEAWDAGTIPIAWIGSGGPAEIILASGGGLLYEEQSGESLAKVLKQVIALSPLERQEIIQRGRAWLKTHCDPESYSKKMLSLWQDVLN